MLLMIALSSDSLAGVCAGFRGSTYGLVHGKTIERCLGTNKLSMNK